MRGGVVYNLQGLKAASEGNPRAESFSPGGRTILSENLARLQIEVHFLFAVTSSGVQEMSGPAMCVRPVRHGASKSAAISHGQSREIYSYVLNTSTTCCCACHDPALVGFACGGAWVLRLKTNQEHD